MSDPGRLLIRGCRLLDVEAGTYRDSIDVLIEGDSIREVSDRPVKTGDAVVIEAGGHVALPGLIDAHVHTIGVTLDLPGLARIPPYLVAAQAKGVLEGMLMRGFTTVRDAGGADWGLAEAVRRGYFAGPRLFVSGLALAQSGGQGDFRARGEAHLGCPVCRGARSITRVVDGVDDMRRAVRDELRDGADQIKIMASGGIASDIPIDRAQFAADEIAAAVDEAGRAGTYVMAHVYDSHAIRRCIELGVRSLEHASLIDAPTAAFAAEKGVFIVPTLSVFQALSDEGPALGYPPAKVERIRRLLRDAMGGLETAWASRARIGHGSDLEGSLHTRQSGEFRLKAEVMPIIDVIRSATVVNAALLGMEGRLGIIAEGAIADILLVDGDPLEDIGCLADPEAHLRLVVKDGRIEKNSL